MPVAPDTAFVLPADVVLLRPDEVDADVRADAGLTGGDRVLVRRGSRHAPKAVSAELAVLLEQFRTPTTLADGVVSVAVAAAVDAEVMLVEAFPALVELSRTDYLVPAGTPAAVATDYRLVAGQRLGDCVLVAPVRVLRDGEIWRGRHADGRLVAVKLLTDPHWGPLLVGREAALLARLAGRGATRLVGSEVGPAGAWIATEWVAGVPVDLHARRLRGSTDEVTGRRAVAAALLNAYAKVHGSGVLHGDVHAGNAIRRPDGTVTLIDLGLGRLDGEPDDGTLPRAFATDHLDPVTARALLAGEPPPAPTLAAERYAVATLAFELVTGSPAHRPATTVEDARRAVLAPGFRRFADVGTPAWPAGERVLRRLAGLPG